MHTQYIWQPARAGATKEEKSIITPKLSKSVQISTLQSLLATSTHTASKQ